MASSQASGAGDGPTRFTDKNADSPPSSPWKTFPLKEFNALGIKLDKKDLLSLRLVCTEWMKTVEQSGLKVKVDESIQGNLEFVKRIKVESARVLNWTVDIGAEPANGLFQYPECLRKLKLCGKMPKQWKIENLTTFPNLEHLVLRDRTLHSNNLTGQPYPVINFDPTSELSIEEMLIQALQTQVSYTEAQPIQLKSLQKLEIISLNHYYPNAQTTQIQPHSYFVMMANMCFILNCLKSPQLSVAHLHVTPPYNVRASYDKLNWKLLPLHKFLDNHRTSLQQLYLPDFHVSSDVLKEHENLSKSFPINLRKLMLDLQGEGRDPYSRVEPTQATFTYLQECLNSQTQLQDVHFTFSGFPVKWTSDAFASLANSCGKTLRYLELEGYPDEHSGTIDLQILSVCQCLEVLHLPEWGRTSITFRNIEKLPISLKRLVLCEGEGSQMDIGDPNVFKRLIALEWLYLDCIRLPASPNGNQEPQRQLYRTMIKGLLGLRQLQGFYVEFQGVGLHTDRNTVAMLNLLGRNINPALRYSHGYFCINLEWRWFDSRHPPWSDRPFDNGLWNMEKNREEEEGPVENANDEENDAVDQDDDNMDVDLVDEDVSSDEDDLI